MQKSDNVGIWINLFENKLPLSKSKLKKGVDETVNPYLPLAPRSPRPRILSPSVTTMTLTSHSGQLHRMS